MPDQHPTPDPQHRVSVVVPTRNRAAALERCLAALAVQTRPADEVIVVDDASDDGTAALLPRMAQERPDLRLQALRNDPQRGANPSRNRAVREATGDVVAFTDDDCAADPAWLEHLVAPFADARVGAVTGRTESVPARNLYELTWKGTQRVHAPDGVRATRLVGCNMAVRRRLLLEHGLDEDRARPDPDVRVSGRGDEEGLYLRLDAAGWEQRVAPAALVLHDHPHTAATLMRQAWRGGRSAARLVRAYRLPPRLDLLPFLLAYAALPVLLVDWRLWPVPAVPWTAGIAAIVYNDLCRKGKTIGELLVTLPILLAYYHVRVAGYAVETLRGWLGRG